MPIYQNKMSFRGLSAVGALLFVTSPTAVCGSRRRLVCIHSNTRVYYFQPSGLLSAVVSEMPTLQHWLVSLSSHHTLNLQVTALLMWTQYVETDGAEWKKVTFSTSYVALLMRSLKNPHNTPSVRSVGINNSAGDEFCQKPRVIFIFFFIEPWSCWSSAQRMKLQLSQPMTKCLSGPLKWIRSM